MYDPNANPQPRRRGWLSKTIVAVAATGGLVVGAIYGPLLWQSTGAAAQTPTSAATTTGAVPMQTLDSSLDEDQAALAALYEQLSPSVVNIAVESVASASEQLPNMPDIPGFELPNMPQQDVPQYGEGSGFIYDNQGHIVTNNHVVEGATKVTVNFANGFWASADVVATDPQADLAVIKDTPPEGMDWVPLNLADDGSLKVGHTVIAMGNPFGLENTMTTGIVSALGRSFPVGSFGENRYSLPDVIQTDAAINPGNSGGPLFDLNGNVVGVNFAIESSAGVNSGVGFAIPVSILKRVVPELINDGQYDYAYLGLSGTTISAGLAEALDLPENQLGVYVASIVPGGPAEKAGIRGGDETVTVQGADLQKGGDIVTAINDQPVHRFEDLVSFLVTKANPGETVTLTVIRDGAEQKIDVELGARPTSTTAAAAEPSQGNEDNGQGNGQGNGEENRQGQISARAAIAIAEDAAKQKGLTGDVTETVVTQDQQDGADVWVVELSTDSQQATVVVNADSGDVVSVDVQ